MKIKNEYDYLIHLIYCAIHKIPPQELPKKLSFEKVFLFAKKHEVANFAYLSVEKLQNKPDDKLLDLWKQEYWKGVRRDALQNNARDEILCALHNNCIYTLEVQGTAVKQYYPKSHLRMMSDIDIIIPKEKSFHIERIMQDLGYKTQNIDDTEIIAHKGAIHVELHTDFFAKDMPSFLALNNAYDYATLNDDYTANVSDTVFYLFHLLHTIKHAEHAGVGIRRIIDLYYLENVMQNKADLQYIDSVLEEYGFLDTKEKLIAVKNKWFCDITPSIAIKSLEKDIEFAGTHGKQTIYVKNNLKREKEQGKHFVKLRHLFSQIFLSKKDYYEAFPFCEKHHYPIVLCFFHRTICIIFNPKRWKNIKEVFERLK